MEFSRSFGLGLQSIHLAFDRDLIDTIGTIVTFVNSNDVKYLRRRNKGREANRDTSNVL